MFSLLSSLRQVRSKLFGSEDGENALQELVTTSKERAKRDLLYDSWNIPRPASPVEGGVLLRGHASEQNMRVLLRGLRMLLQGFAGAMDAHCVTHSGGASE